MSTITTVIADARKVAGLIEPALAIVALAQSLTKVGGPGAAAAIQVLDAAVKAFEAGAAGTMTSAEVTARISSLETTLDDTLAADNAGAHSALDAKFPTG